MFVRNEAGTRGFYHLIGRDARYDEMHERGRWAKSIDKTVHDAHLGWIGRAARPVAYPAVVSAATPALLAISDALRDPRQPVSPAALTDLRRFLTDGVSSPLFGRDPLAARRGAEALRRAFTGQPEPAYGVERVAVG